MENRLMKKTPMRRCIGCMESKPKNQLVRIAGYEGTISIDPTGKAKGRGVYLCRNQDCFRMAQKKKAIGRGLKMEVSSQQVEKLFRELGNYETED